MKRSVRNSAKALIIKDGKMLAIKIDDNDDIFYIMPGGGQEAGELLTDTVRREVAEELGIDVIPQSLQFVIEGANGESFHRLDLVFLCEYVGKLDGAILHGDTNQIGYEWLPIDTILTQPLYPSKLRRQIKNLYHGKPTTVYLGNEEIGDPEFLD
ncbi:MAG TPA: NUDIX domain-containing protein [Lachnospiraceae bacterium]|nr:NUDIX domain-containing protein [Lachnospiraceae bacterium]